mgnify:CR=1 FL=1
MNISINQGIKFNNLQQKITKETIKQSKRKKKYFRSKEGFTNRNILMNDFDKTMLEYKQINQDASTEIQDNIYRDGPGNQFNNSNVKLSGPQATGYVTSEGVYKWYPSTEIFNATAGKNNCPVNVMDVDNNSNNFNIPGSVINTSPPLDVGSQMVAGQSCGNESSLVYVNKVNDDKNNVTYQSCYSLIPTDDVVMVPLQTSSTPTPGWTITQSSTYTNNVNNYGAWKAFNMDPNNYWHSSTDSDYLYNSSTGDYIGNSNIGQVNINGVAQSILGEYMIVGMPVGQNSVLHSYSISPRIDLYSTRSPNSWYLLGSSSPDGSSWDVIDSVENWSFDSSTSIFQGSLVDKNSTPYNSYALVVTKVGNSSSSSNRYCVQVAQLILSGSLSTASDDNNLSMTNITGDQDVTFEQCVNIAGSLGYQYFGVGQDVNGNNRCYGSNDLDKIISNPEVTTSYKAIPIWSSGTWSGENQDGTPYYASLENNGEFSIKNKNEDQTSYSGIWTANSGGDDICRFRGLPNPYTITGSYGGNCIGKPKNIDCGNPQSETYGSEGIQGNLDSAYKQVFNDNYRNTTFSFPALQGWNGSDPAYCCSKLVDYSYQCGGGEFKAGQVSAGSNINVDCSQEESLCKFYIILGNDANLSIYKGAVGITDNLIWSTNTSGRQMNQNPDSTSIKGKYERNYLNVGETLGNNEKLCSDDGSCFLIMQSDGNLVLYVWKSSEGCTKDADDNTIGKTNNVGLYTFNQMGNPNNIGKLSYVDRNSTRYNIPANMQKLTKVYNNLYPGINLPGNNFPSMPLNNISKSGCESQCNEAEDCYGYVYVNDTQTCWLKEKPEDISFNYNNPQVSTSLKIPTWTGQDPSCSTKRENIDSILFENYPTGGDWQSNMSCSQQLISKTTNNNLQSITDKLNSLGQQLVDETNIDLENSQNMQIQMAEQNKIAEQDIMEYDKVQAEINYLTKGRHREGMTNLEDIKAMEQDASLWVNMENSEFVLWTLIALGLVSATIYFSSKKKK